MAVNLNPQYLEEEQEFKKAQSAEDKLTCLKKMWTFLPKHKASEKLQSELKKKMSALREEVETAKQSPKKGGVSYKIPRQGAGQIVVIGAPNAGKSSMLAKLTRATPEIGAFPFTTHEPTPGMMEWEDVKIQLIDTPPITGDYLEGWLQSMVRTADAAVLLVDLGDDDGPLNVDPVIDRLAQVKTMLVREGTPPDEDLTVEHVKTLMVANKIDAPGAADRLEMLKELYGSRFPIEVVSLEQGTNVPELRTALYKLLNVIRVYTKKPGKPADMASPFTIPDGGTVLDLAGSVHRDLVDSLKSARLWGTGVFEGQTVTRDHVLHDKDVVELHT